MYKWYFTVSTLEKGTISYKVTANNKQDAIKKGFAMLDKKGLSYANRFDCTMVRF